MADHGTFYWNELSTTDIEGAKAFCGNLGGWRFSEMPMENGDTYYIAMVGEAPVGGIMGMPEGAPAGMPPYWRAYAQSTMSTHQWRRPRRMVRKP